MLWNSTYSAQITKENSLKIYLQEALHLEVYQVDDNILTSTGRRCILKDVYCCLIFITRAKC